MAYNTIDYLICSKHRLLSCIYIIIKAFCNQLRSQINLKKRLFDNKLITRNPLFYIAAICLEDNYTVAI